MTFISLLRGVNVSGQKLIKMADLKAMYEAIGLNNVTSYVQSGNVIFQATEKDARKLEQVLESNIAETFGFHVPVRVLTLSEMKNVLDKCPFGPKIVAKDPTKVLVSFLSARPDDGAIAQIEAVASKSEQIRFDSQLAYLYCPDGYGKSKLNNNFLEKKLKLISTTRNWKSVQKLYELAVSK
ncbi:MAG: DUF1697 domain-containing protein [Gammaproteobacteria bacterium]|nr:DUF1697 domain-containing protein [Gammaproteobacteria bacterium]